MPVPPWQPSSTVIPVPQVEGVTVSLFSVDYEQMVDKNGKLLPGQSDTPIQVAYKVERDGVASIGKDYTLIVPDAHAVEGANPKPRVIPEILQWKGDKGTCTISDTIEFAYDYQLPVGKKVKLEIIGAPGKTTVKVDGKDIGSACIKSFHNIDTDVVDTLILPLQTLGKSLQGKVYSMTVTPKHPGSQMRLLTTPQTPACQAG